MQIGSRRVETKPQRAHQAAGLRAALLLLAAPMWTAAYSSDASVGTPAVRVATPTWPELGGASTSPPRWR